MSYAMEYDNRAIAAEASESARAGFMRRTYMHLAGAILAFVLVEAVLLSLPLGENFVRMIVQNPVSWLVVLVAFMAVSWVAERWAMSDMSPGMQYAGLGLYVLAEAVIFLPLMWIAVHFYPNEAVITKAAILTLSIFGGLTVAVLVTGQDFSFLRTTLVVSSFVLLGLIVAGIAFGFGMGLFILFAFVAFACGVILYQTSNILHHYHTDQHVAAALGLFAAVALLFYYILMIVMRNAGDN